MDGATVVENGTDDNGEEKKWGNVGKADWAYFDITLEEILSNSIPALNVDILEPVKEYDQLDAEQKEFTSESTQSGLVKLRNVVSKWYLALRNLAIVGLLCVLVYIGIRMIISSTSAEKAKYKQLIWNWLVALCLVFVLHYIMAFTMFLVDSVNDMLNNTTINKIPVMNGDKFSVELTNGDSSSLRTVDWVNNLMEYARIYTSLGDLGPAMGFTIIYLVLVVYTIWFIIIYIKRFIYMIFLTLMAPMVALTYPLDKVGDGKAQAFDMWFKEYVFNALVQPFHLLIYTVFVSMAIEFATSNLVYACVAIGFIIPAEKTLRKMFKMDRATATGSLGGFAGGAMASTLINKLASGKSKSGGNGTKDGSDGKSEIPTKSPDEGGFLGEGNQSDITPEQFEQQGQNGSDASEYRSDLTEEQRQRVSDLENSRNYLNQLGNENNGDNDFYNAALDDDRALDEFRQNAKYDSQGNKIDYGTGNAIGEGGSNPSPDSGAPIRQMSSSSSNNNNTTRGTIDGVKNVIGKTFKRTLGNKQGWKNFAKGTAKKAAGVALGGLVGAGAGLAALATGQDASAVLTKAGAGLAAGYYGGSRIAGNIGNRAYSMYSTAKNDYLEGRYGAEYVNDKAAHEQYVNNEQKQKWLNDNFTNADGSPLSRKEMRERLDQSYELERMGITDNKDRVDAMKMEDRLYKERLKEAEERGELQGRDIEKLKKQYREQARNKTAVAYKYAGQYKKSDLRDTKKVEQLQKELEAKISAKDVNGTMSAQQIRADAGKATKLVLEAAKVSDPRRTATPRNS